MLFFFFKESVPKIQMMTETTLTGSAFGVSIRDLVYLFHQLIKLSYLKNFY